MWATGPKLPQALALMSEWGFTYKTIGFVWVKQNLRTSSLFWGMGFYTRANAELCLIGAKGKGLTRKDAGVHQIIEAPVGKHSRKPDETRHRIERLYDGPYLELFARERAPGWDAWGDELPEEESA